MTRQRQHYRRSSRGTIFRAGRGSPISMHDAMIRNTRFMEWASKMYPSRKFILPTDVDEFRISKGLSRRPARFRV